LTRPHQVSETHGRIGATFVGEEMARQLLRRAGMRARVGFLILGLALAAGCGGGKSCSQLQDEYTQELPTALLCDPTAANQCQQQAMSPGSCSCGTTVQDPTQLNAIVAQLRLQGCIPAQQLACPCAAPQQLTCVSNGGSSGSCIVQPRSGG
jgi:hypothetical protein